MIKAIEIGESSATMSNPAVLRDVFPNAVSRMQTEIQRGGFNDTLLSVPVTPAVLTTTSPPSQATFKQVIVITNQWIFWAMEVSLDFGVSSFIKCICMYAHIQVYLYGDKIHTYVCVFSCRSIWIA